MKRKLIYCFFILLLCQNAYSQNMGIRGNISSLENNDQQQKKRSGADKRTMFYEGFDHSDFPPKDWERVATNKKSTWFSFDIERRPFSKINPDSKFSAVCPFDTTFQEEWLYLPEIDIADTSTLSIEFYAGYSHQWLDSANLSLFVTNDQGESWDSLWSGHKDDNYFQWKWRKVRIDLYDYANDTLNRDLLSFAFRYKGRNGDLMAIDDVNLLGGGLNEEADIVSFVLPNQVNNAEIDTLTNIVKIEIISDPKLTSLSPEILVSRGATIFPGENETISYTYTGDTIRYDYTVTAADQKTQEDWEICIVMAEPNKEAEVVYLSLDNQTHEAVVDTLRNTVSVEVEYGTPLTDVYLQISVSHGATTDIPTDKGISLEVGEPFKFQVFPQDPFYDPQEYKLIVKERDYMNHIVAFKVDNEINKAHIDTLARTVIDTVAYESDFNELNPLISVSPGAIISPNPEEENITFVSGVAKEFTITAANGDKQTWKVYIIRDLYLIYSQNFDNPEALDIAKWQTKGVGETPLWQVKKQERFPFSEINPISKYSLLCPYSKDYSDEWAFSDVIGTDDIENLMISFQVGYKKEFIDSATVELFIVDTELEDTMKVWDLNSAAVTDTTSTWHWRAIKLEINQYRDKNIKIAYRYVGKNGDLIGIDDIKVYDNSTVVNSIVNPEKMKDFHIYPNPVQTNLYVIGQNKARFSILDISGRCVKQGVLFPGKNEIKLSGLKNGVYLLNLETKSKQLVEKFIIN